MSKIGYVPMVMATSIMVENEPMEIDNIDENVMAILLVYKTRECAEKDYPDADILEVRSSKL